MEKKLELEIKQTIEQYKKAKSFTNKSIHFNSAYGLIDVYADLTKKTYSFYPSTKDIILHQYLQLEQHRKLFSGFSKPKYRNEIEQISENGIDVIEDNITLKEQTFSKHINYDKACEIILSFFEKNNSILLPFVKNTLTNNIIFCKKDSEKIGYSINIQSLGKTYIVIYGNKNRITIEMLITIVHEIGHAIYNKHSKIINPYLKYNNFLEILPHFLEQIFIEFCIEHNIYKKECAKARYNDFLVLYNYLVELGITNQFVQKVNLNDLSLTLNLTDLQQVQNFDFQASEITFLDCHYNYLYSYGLLLGFYYYKLYTEIPTFTKQSIRHLMRNIDSNIDLGSSQYLLNNYGINIEELKSCEFLEELIKDTQKTLNKNTQI